MSGGVTKTLSYWWAWDQNALEAVNQLADLGLGVFYHQRDGSSQFHGGNQTSLTGTINVDESELLRTISIKQPWDVVRNEIIVKNYPKKYVANTDPLWTIDGDLIYLQAWQSQIIEAKLQNEPGYGITSAAGLTEADFNFVLTNDPVPGGVFNIPVISIIKYSSSILFNMYNDSGGPMYLTTGIITPAYDIYNTDVYNVQASDLTSQAAYGKKTFVLDTPFMQNPLYAQECANYLLSKFKDPSPYPIVQAEARPALQFLPDIYRYRFNLSLPTMGISDYFRIGGIEHQWLSENGNSVRTTFWLEPYVTPFSYTP